VFFRNQPASPAVFFNPFAVKINPRTGGDGPVATLNGITASQFAMDARRNFFYLDINNDGLGDTGISGAPAMANTFLNHLWITRCGVSNTGEKDPLSYFANTSLLASRAGYIDNSTAGSVFLKVNPDKFVDASGNYARGILKGQYTYVTDGLTANINNGTNFNGLIIWLDESF
jgi:hypothetical protein